MQVLFAELGQKLCIDLAAGLLNLQDELTFVHNRTTFDTSIIMIVDGLQDDRPMVVYFLSK